MPSHWGPNSNLYAKNMVLFEISPLKVVCNEMEGGSDTGGLNSYWYGTLVIVFGLSFNGGVVF